MTAGSPVTPVTPVVGPSAVSVQSVATAVPPLSFVTSLTRVSVDGWAVFVIEHVTSAPVDRVTTPSVTATVPPRASVHVQSPAS